ncbi:NTP transferase domain-containing protein [Comamonas sp. lk]|uniref:nucleotidyltransferase family protein n=1 Tax=Comamonas sp. lk TaxID=2201272 RepID=UPI000EB1A63D|nr:NTP transferase domain-containing protein [Comamonas sp. lk]
MSSHITLSKDLPCVLILAAGRGERFLASGGSTHKLAAALGNSSVLEATLAAVQASGLPWHLERGPHSGMGDSIAAAVRTTHGTKARGGWLILPADLPLVLPTTLQAVARGLQQAHSDALAVVQPLYQGQKGHPVAFSQAAAEKLMALSGDQGASAIVQQARAAGNLHILPVDDVGVVLDVDTVTALEQARKIWRERQPASR